MLFNKSIKFFIGITFLMLKNCYAQNTELISNRNVGIFAGSSILESDGITLAMPGYFYGSERHVVSGSPTVKLTSDMAPVYGINLGYFHYIKPRFKDVSFFCNYNVTWYSEKNASVIHNFGIGTQIDIGKYAFIQHSVGLGFHHSTCNFCNLGPTCQLKLSIGFYISKISINKSSNNDIK